MKTSKILFLLAIVSCNSADNKTTEKLSNNLAIFFHDFSLLKENPSIQLYIDEKLILESDSITKTKRQDIDMNLDTGLHIVSVQTKDRKYKTTDTINIKESNQRYLLTIQFQYNPPTDQYEKWLINEIYKRTLIKNKIKPDTSIEWLIDSVANEYERGDKSTLNFYKPGDRHFEIEFEEQPLLE